MKKLIMAIMILSLVACSNKKKENFLGFYKEEQFKRTSKEPETLHIYREGNSYFINHNPGSVEIYWNAKETVFYTGYEYYVYSESLKQLTIIRRLDKIPSSKTYKKISQ